MTWEHWSDEDLRFLAASYPVIGNKVLARTLHRTERALIAMAKRRGLKKGPIRLRRMGRANKKGKTKKAQDPPT